MNLSKDTTNIALTHSSHIGSFFRHFKNDLPASIVVFFVALPLCLGIALASGAPLFSGIIAGVVGGVIIGFASGSPLGISGPAAGLAVIVATSISTLGSWPTFLLAVVLAGVFQLLMGFGKAGFIAFFFPSSVIKGMLSGIGLLIIIKQVPYSIGYNPSATNMADSITHGALLIGIVSMLILLLWEQILVKKHRVFQLLQGPIVVVAFGVGINFLYQTGALPFLLNEDQLVRLPVANSLSEFLTLFTFPDFSAITNFEVWKIAFVLAIVASLETLLCVEATDKLDPYKRVTPTNRELKAQGLGNIFSGLIGGLPLTQVIVRSSANINFGGKTKLSAILHGVFLLVSALTITQWLNMIPLASLATILILVGYKLAKPSLFKTTYQLGWEQFIPFSVTIVGILTMDLLKGIIVGMIAGIYFTLHHSYRNAYHMKNLVHTEDGQEIRHLVLAEEVSFFNKGSIIQTLESIPSNSKVIIDCSNSKSIAYDVVELIQNYKDNAKSKNISVETIKFIEPKK